LPVISSNLDVNGANHDINGAIALDHVTVSGITTVSSNTIVGGSLDVNGTNHDINGAIALDHVTVSGIVTATAFVDDGTIFSLRLIPKHQQVKQLLWQWSLGNFNLINKLTEIKQKWLHQIL
jgi:hypothetical protein